MSFYTRMARIRKVSTAGDANVTAVENFLLILLISLVGIRNLVVAFVDGNDNIQYAYTRLVMSVFI